MGQGVDWPAMTTVHQNAAWPGFWVGSWATVWAVAALKPISTCILTNLKGWSDGLPKDDPSNN